MRLRGVHLALLLFLAAGPCLGQSDDPDEPAATPSKPAAPRDASANASSEKKKTKKVWTNEDIGSVGGVISVVGVAKPSSSVDEKKKPEPASNSTAEDAHQRQDDARQRQIENYRNQMEQIRSQMNSIDDRIAQLKSFKAENTSASGGINPNHGYNMVPLEDQVKQLEEKKKHLESKIGDIEVEARKNGIDPGDLR